MNDRQQTDLDRRAVRLAFNRAAGGYDDNAVLQREIADRLVTRLDLIRLTPHGVLDLGCGTGYATRLLRKRYPRARLTGLDLAASMTRKARHSMDPVWWRPFRQQPSFVTADAGGLPFADSSFDLVFSNLALQWCQPELVFHECRRVLRPGGLLMFTSFGPDTLRELRLAWQTVDREHHVHDFVDMHDLGDTLVRAGFADPVMDSERLTLTYGDLRQLLREIKGIGAHNALANRHAALTGKQRFASFQQAYEAFRRTDGRLPVSYEVVYGHAWMPLQTQSPDVTIISLDSLRGRRR